MPGGGGMGVAPLGMEAANVHKCSVEAQR
jgi:hypothetical protein